jgi:hypothetical protein
MSRCDAPVVSLVDRFRLSRDDCDSLYPCSQRSQRRIEKQTGAVFSARPDAGGTDKSPKTAAKSTPNANRATFKTFVSWRNLIGNIVGLTPLDGDECVG